MEKMFHSKMFDLFARVFVCLVVNYSIVKYAFVVQFGISKIQQVGNKMQKHFASVASPFSIHA